MLAPMKIDVHAHVLSESYLDRVVREGAFGFQRGEDGAALMPDYGPLDPGVYRHEKRLELLVDTGIDLQLVGPLINFVAWPGGAAGVEQARALNQSTAECVAGSGGRFAGLAALALGEPDQAVDELVRAVEEHGFVGAVTGTYAGDRPLDHASLEPLWAEIEARELLLFMHPSSSERTPLWDEYTLAVALAWPNETARAVSRLIFAGTLERHPALPLVLAHGGGTLPFLRGRLNLAYAAPTYEYNPDCHAQISKPPADYFDQLLFDTAVGAAESLHFLIESVGAERVVLGTDDPFEIADTGGRVAFPALQERPAEEREQILGDTLAGLLGL